MTNVSGQPGSGETAAADGLPPGFTKQQMGGALSKLLSASVGDIVAVFSRSPAHKHFAFGDLDWMVLPAVVSGQFYVAEAEHKEAGFRAPVACVLWASVSEEVDRRLETEAGRRIRVRPDEWTSGQQLWIVDVAGEPRMVQGVLKHLMEQVFKDRSVKLVVRDASGATKVETLQGLARAAAIAAVGMESASPTAGQGQP